MSILESLTFTQYFFVDSFMFGICMYTFIFDKTYIYLETCLVFDKNRISHVWWFSCFWVRNFMWTLLIYFHVYGPYMNLVHSISFVYLWFWSMSLYMLHGFLSIDSCVICIHYEIYICFIPYLKDFVLVFKIIINYFCYFSIW